jgi:hypothetical protein
MPRFSSFKPAPRETRKLLRDRFSRKLLLNKQPTLQSPNRSAVADHLILKLLAGMKVTSNAEWRIAEATYAAAEHSAGEPADLQSLESLGWVRRIWGHVVTSSNIRTSAHRAPAGTMDAFKALFSTIHKQRFEFSAAARAEPGLVPLIEDIEAGRSEPSQIVNRTPEWIAARLWEICLSEERSPAEALYRWVELWGHLRNPSFVPSDIWSVPDAEAFRNAALAALGSEPSLGEGPPRETYTSGRGHSHMAELGTRSRHSFRNLLKHW